MSNVPVEAFEANRNRGDPKACLTQEVERGHGVSARLAKLGLGIDKVTQKLESEGVGTFTESLDVLLESSARTSPPQRRTVP